MWPQHSSIGCAERTRETTTIIKNRFQGGTITKNPWPRFCTFPTSCNVAPAFLPLASPRVLCVSVFMFLFRATSMLRCAILCLFCYRFLLVIRLVLPFGAGFVRSYVIFLWLRSATHAQHCFANDYQRCNSSSANGKREFVIAKLNLSPVIR